MQGKAKFSFFLGVFTRENKLWSYDASSRWREEAELFFSLVKIWQLERTSGCSLQKKDTVTLQERSFHGIIYTDMETRGRRVRRLKTIKKETIIFRETTMEITIENSQESD